MEGEEVIKADEAGSMEEVFGEKDSMFRGEPDKPVNLTGSQEAGMLPPGQEDILKAPDDEPVDLTGTQEIGVELDGSEAIEVAEYAGEQITFDEPDGPPATDEPDTEVVGGAVNTERPIKDIPKEEPITHLKNPENKNKVFPATPALMKRKDLVPCDENGKTAYDHRRF